MNAERRKILAQAQQLIEEAQSLVEQAAGEERDYYDNMPEGLQAGERGERADEVATLLEELDENLSEAIGTLSEAQA